MLSQYQNNYNLIALKLRILNVPISFSPTVWYICFLTSDLVLMHLRCHRSTVHENIIGTPKMRINFWYSIKIKLISIAPNLLIALAILRWKNVSLLTSLLHVLYQFMASFPYCSSNYYVRNNCRSFTLLKALANRNRTLFAIASKSEKDCKLSLS